MLRWVRWVFRDDGKLALHAAGGVQHGCVDGTRVQEESVLRLYEQMEDGYVWVDAMVVGWRDGAWIVDFTDKDVNWGEGEAPVPSTSVWDRDEVPPVAGRGDHPVRKHQDKFSEAAEGRAAPPEWLTWWDDTLQEMEGLCERDVLYWLDPEQRGYDCRQVERKYRNSAEFRSPSQLLERMSRFQEVTARLLCAWGMKVEVVRRYESEVPALRAQEQAEAVREEERMRAEYLPVISGLGRAFPKLAWHLKRLTQDIEELHQGLSEEQIEKLEHQVSVPFPAAYRRFLGVCGGVWVRSLDLRTSHLALRRLETGDTILEKCLCFGEYWLEADGDVVFFDLAKGGDDPAVLYYAHESGPAVKKIGRAFSTWINGLGKHLGSDEE